MQSNDCDVRISFGGQRVLPPARLPRRLWLLGVTDSCSCPPQPDSWPAVFLLRVSAKEVNIFCPRLGVGSLSFRMTHWVCHSEEDGTSDVRISLLADKFPFDKQHSPWQRLPRRLWLLGVTAPRGRAMPSLGVTVRMTSRQSPYSHYFSCAGVSCSEIFCYICAIILV